MIANPLDDGERRYEWEAGRRLKKVWVRQKPEDGIRDGVDGESNTTLRIQFTNGNLLTGETTATTVSAKVLKGEEDITSEYAASAFVWARDMGNAEADAAWNAAHNGMKEFTVSASDLTDDMKLTCTLTGTSPDYGTVYVDENMNLIHAPAEADANDTLHLENCILSVETPNNEYHLNGNVLSVVRQRLNGSVTAEAWVYTAAPEKLVEFKYNHEGYRVQKDITKDHHTISIKYHLYDRFITRVESGTQIADIQYDKHMRPAFIKFHGHIYNYLYNLQNDIVGIADERGQLVAEYWYDSWGIEQSERIFDFEIAHLNPYRFRGYVYDPEIKMLYLNNRYYNYEIHRFINADSLIGAKIGLIDHNVFAYCKNDCVNRYDPKGNLAIAAIGMIGTGISSWAAIVNWPGFFQTAGNVFQQGCMAILTALNIQSSSNEITENDDAAVQEADAARYRRQIVFPQAPAAFLPIGLEVNIHPGTKNGMIVDYKDPITGTVIFRWDENINGPNGQHYHILAEQFEGYHFYPGDIIPEPFATIYFGGM